MKNLYVFYFLFFFTSSLWAQAPAGYYDAAAGQTGAALKLSLYNIIKGHIEYPYTATTTDVWDILKESDRDPNNPNNVILIYTGWSVDAAQEYNNGAGWSREHVWAKSRGDFGTELGAGTDCHHLRPCDISVNSARNNRWFAECNEMYYDNGIATGSYTSSTEWVWKPRDEVKGDAARMIFYMATRYEGEGGEPDLEPIDYIPADNYTIEPIHALLSDLLLWHQQDPVDNFERNRNEVVYGYQQNRNPFVDHPEYVDAIWGSVPTPTDPPAAPQNLNLVASSTNLSLSWSDVSTEDGYYVYRSTDNINYNLLATLGTNTLSYVDNNVVEAQTYYYYVIAFNTYGNSTASNTVSGQLNTSPGGNATDLFFSEYVEGSSYNKALEVSNFTGVDIDLSRFVIKKQTNGAGDWSTGYALSGILANGQSYVVAHTLATQAILDVADATSSAGEFIFNGNDAVSLWKDGVLIDILGTFNDGTNYAIDVTLIRNSNIGSPNTVYTTAEWTSYSIDYIADLGTHTFDGGVVPPTCDVPIGLLASNITTTTADLSWTAVTDAVDYSVQYKTTIASTWTTAIAGTNSLSISGLTPDTQYEFQVATNCSAATSAYSTSTLFTTSAGNATDLFFSEYVEGSSYNKALEVSNFTGVDVDLSRFVIKKQTNGAGDWSTGYTLTGILANGQSYVVAHTLAIQAILDVADATSSAGEFIFNGNDAVSLWKDGVLIDIIGTFNDATNYAIDVTLIRNSNINSPNIVYTPAEWTSYSTDYIADLGTHTFDGGVVPATCDVPTGLLASNITTTTADLSWTAVIDAIDYSVQYKTTIATTWTTAIASTNSLSISGLTPDTQYEFQVATNCSAATSAYSISTLFTTQPEIILVTYCEPTGGTGFEWINYVELADMSNISGQSATGYSDFTNIIANVTAGQIYPISFQADFKRTFYTEYWSVWIDFNKDGDFADAGEILAQGSTNDDGIYYLNIAIPADAALGETRLRIAMNDAGYFDACYSPKYGATEDYTVNIGAAALKEALSDINAQKAEFTEPKGFAIYPNPAADYIFVQNKENAQVEIYSATGKKVYKSVITNNRLDIGQLKTGIYLLKFNNGGKISTQRLIKQ